ncbi:glyoxal oxidase N-terminus-domain-containing protein [Phakopsora pachyrhizi]|uniref:Glyoxal oxidase N-terminus-domain-containing protein n=1 Tax=Phakopsora pachyrhizi TaxID=170000 RepID=A0AAV0BPJ1_PHAPC|nr:glyoxal oxidase N-terminus-domain-containing protein [Phakopsora pachyrhizi]CAH7687946.1 glyoxal oxidase N-terminus-domain-containing protein [Phakopsora pachyrhizi]
MKENRKLVTRDLTTQSWTLAQNGTTGVSAMQLSIISEKFALIIDKVERNPLNISGHSAWGALYNLNTHEVRALDLQSNSFCAAGSFLGNGTFISVGGNAVVNGKTNGDTDGKQSIRFLEPCQDKDCSIEEYPSIKMQSRRWYPSLARLADGTVMIAGGSKNGSWINSAAINNPTIEYFPPKKLGFALNSSNFPIKSPFLTRTLNSNLYPILITLPEDDLVFMAANKDAMLYNWKTNEETKLPPFPNNVRVTYPFTGSGLLLPLTPENNYRPEVLICGGSNLPDNVPATKLKASDPASAQCVRMVLDKQEIKKGWIVEQMPSPRIMPDMVMMPDGRVLILNGGKTGTAGYGNIPGKVGQSNSDTPSFTPVLYDPKAPLGQRFSSKGLPTSKIARLYHSTATMTPSGKIMIAGSNPNPDSTKITYPTEYRVEWLSPPYLQSNNRPIIKIFPKIANYGESISIVLNRIGDRRNLQGLKIEVVLMDFGYVTHSVPMNSRSVKLPNRLGNLDNEILAQIPVSRSVYPPGFAFIHVLVNGVPSQGHRMMIGNGKLYI